MSDNTTRRAFYCQDSLWQSFSDLAVKRGCAVDTLLNEAMTAYLQSFPAPMPQNQNNYAQQAYAASPQASPARAPVSPHQASPAYGRQPAPINAVNPAYRSGNSIPPAPVSPQAGRIPPAPPAQNYRRPPSIFEEPVSEGPMPGGKPMVLASLSQPAQPQNNAAMIPQPQAYAQRNQQIQQGQPPLYIIFGNQRYTVEKDKYIIGRSSQLADLVIRDGNISRKHCAVIFKNGSYYIKDLDSTNGIEFQGHRIDTKRIEEGDQFNICEFHFTFTYR
ncbi:MAG: FHA domain-containing protein [Proteobacteria bacterium]|nr:FHA domain-containing protein [Pseudomonadota bacterium]